MSVFDFNLLTAKRHAFSFCNLERGGVCTKAVLSLLQLDSEFFVGVKAPGLRDERLREVRVNTPVALFVRVGQRASRYAYPDVNQLELLDF